MREEQQELPAPLPLLSGDLQRKLGLILGQIVERSSNWANATPPTERKLFQFIQSANLSQLARLERDLRRLGSEQLSALASNPTPADRLLFPHLPALFGQSPQLDQFAGAALANWSQISAELNYCLYMRQLYANGSDPLSLLQSRSAGNSERHLTDESVGWQLNQSQAARRKVHKTRRFTTAPTFNHLRQINLISQLIGSNKAHEGGAENLDEGEPEFDEDSDEQHDNSRSIAMRAGSLNRRAADEYGERADNQLQQLMALESNFDLFIGYLKSKPRLRLEPKQSPMHTNYPNVSGHRYQLQTCI